MTTKAEQETIIRWDQDKRVLQLYTANRAQASKWTRLGYPLEVCGRTRSGEPRGWRGQAPLHAVRFRRLVNGQLPTRRRTPGKPVQPRKIAASTHRNVAGRGKAAGPRGSTSECRNLAVGDTVNGQPTENGVHDA